ncbi:MULTISPECIES: hypothetical protein [Paenibacillus]|uniref:Uncharacterized protein n=1 Tax=Paenibacillus borealis TaxID=160799 RepID=A0ABX3HNQ1_PAEBO|nr:hypothetical protein [Paenibacillus borealis]OMD51775.1 hypothetical protein BSK56_03860 [Paenibacillus borealis]
MKRILLVLLLIVCFASTASVASAEDTGDGFRSAITQKDFQETVVGGQAKLKIPSASNLNPIKDKILAEYFITINSKNGVTFDGGVIYDGDEWELVIFGHSGWWPKSLPNITGKTVDLKFGGEVDNRGEYIVKLTLTVDGTNYSISLDKNSIAGDAPLGWLAENPYYAGLNTVGYELNLVPKAEYASTFYHKLTNTNSTKRAYFYGAEFSIAVPIKKAGGTLDLSKFSWIHKKNSDDAQYTQPLVDQIVYDTYNQTYLYTTMDFNYIP